MDNSQGVTFGSLTAKYLQKLDFGQLDLNKDGVVSEEELSSILEKQELDMLDLSTIDKDADMKVTKDEYDLWQQEASMKDFLKKMEQQARLDMSGHDSEDIALLLEKMNVFQQEFEVSYIKSGENINNMTKAFKEAFPEKYKELRGDVLKNSKSAVKERAIENLLNELSDDAIKGGRSMMGIVDGKDFGLTDKAKMVLRLSLSKEADKFIRKYKGENLETDLTQRLRNFLNETDRDKLSDSIKAWTKVQASIDGKDDKTSMQELRFFAQNFLEDVLTQGLTVNFAGATIRSMTMINPLLSRFSNPKDLKNAIADCIAQISTQTTLEKANGIKLTQDNSVQESSLNLFDISNPEKNIFR